MLRIHVPRHTKVHKYNKGFSQREKSLISRYKMSKVFIREIPEILIFQGANMREQCLVALTTKQKLWVTKRLTYNSLSCSKHTNLFM